MSISQLVYTNEDAEETVLFRDGLDLLLARLAGFAQYLTNTTRSVFKALRHHPQRVHQVHLAAEALQPPLLLHPEAYQPS